MKIHWQSTSPARMCAAAILIAASLSFGGCEVGPNYTRPEMPMPTTWASPTTQPDNIEALAPPSAWWKSLNDPKLNSLIERACEGSLSLRIAKARIEQSRALRAIAVSGQRLRADVGGSYSYNHAHGPLSPVDAGDYQFYTGGFDAVWEADLFGGIRRSIEAADADLQARLEDQHDVLVSLAAETARDYVELRTTQQRAIIARNLVQTQADSLDLARRLYVAGIGSTTDITRAQADLKQDQTRLPELRAQEQTIVHQLGILLGQPPDALAAELATPGAIPSPTHPPSIGVPSELLRRRPDVRRVERQLAAATARIGVAEADLYPKLTITGELGVGSEQFTQAFNWSSRYVGVGPSIHWQLLDGGKILANIDAHKAVRQALLEQYKLTILTALQETEDALVSFRRDLDQHALASQTVDANQETYRVASERYAQGTTGLSSVLDARRTALLSEDIQTTHQGNVAISLIALCKSLGGGWEEIETQTDKPTTDNKQSAPQAQPACVIPASCACPKMTASIAISRSSVRRSRIARERKGLNNASRHDAAKGLDNG